MASIKRSRMSKPVMKYEYFPEVMASTQLDDMGRETISSKRTQLIKAHNLRLCRLKKCLVMQSMILGQW